MDEFTRTCFHEAGHAASALALGVAFERVSVVPSGALVGQFACRELEEGKLNPGIAAVILFAGGAAERHQFLTAPEGALADDERRIADLGLSLQVRKIAKQQAADLIIRQWKVVNAVARKLQTVRVLTFSDVHFLAKGP